MAWWYIQHAIFHNKAIANTPTPAQTVPCLPPMAIDCNKENRLPPLILIPEAIHEAATLAGAGPVEVKPSIHSSGIIATLPVRASALNVAWKTWARVAIIFGMILRLLLWLLIKRIAAIDFCSSQKKEITADLSFPRNHRAYGYPTYATFLQLVVAGTARAEMTTRGRRSSRSNSPCTLHNIPNINGTT